MGTRVAAVRFGALGDQVQFSAVVAALAEHAGQPVDVLAGAGSGADLLEGCQGVGRVIRAVHRRRPAWLAPDLLRTGREMAAQGYQAVFLGDRCPVIEHALSRSQAILHVLGSPAVGQHALDAAFLALQRCGVPVQGALVPRLTPTPASVTDLAHLLANRGLAGRPLITVQMGNARSLHPFAAWRPHANLKAWPEASWVQLVTALAAFHPDAALVLAGAPAEWSANERILRHLAPEVQQRTVNLAQDLPLTRLTALLHLSRGCVSVDTGPAHLAAATGCPLVVLFGPADPRQMAPRGAAPVEIVTAEAACRPCYGTPRRAACRQNVCMSQISVTRVMAAWSRLGHAARAVA